MNQFLVLLVFAVPANSKTFFLKNHGLKKSVGLQFQAPPSAARFITDEVEALKTRFSMIARARSEILVSSYILRDDRTGTCFLKMLAEAKMGRGLRVKILVDSNAGDISAPMKAFLIENGVEIREFRIGKKWSDRRLTHRMHDKIMLTDGNLLLTGSRNLTDCYFACDPVLNFEDTDLLVRDTVTARQARDYFLKIWGSPRLTRAVDCPKISATARAALREKLKNAKSALPPHLQFDEKQAMDFRQKTAPENFSAQFFGEHFTHFEHGKWAETEHKNAGLTDSLIQLFCTAKNFILIENPYFALSDRWFEVFRAARARGVKIRVLTNSVSTNDLLARQAAYLNRRARYLEMGIELWEWQGEKTLHAKTFVIDDSISIVGSYNFHIFSEHHNTEHFVCLAGKNAAAELHAIFEKRLKNALPVGPDNRPKRMVGTHFVRAPFPRRARTWVLRHTVSELRGRCRN